LPLPCKGSTTEPSPDLNTLNYYFEKVSSIAHKIFPAVSAAFFHSALCFLKNILAILKFEFWV
jgi:hypothetical protein